MWLRGRVKEATKRQREFVLKGKDVPNEETHWQAYKVRKKIEEEIAKNIKL